MSSNREEELKSTVASTCERLGIKGHLLVYLDGDRVKFTGDISFSALLPVIMEAMAKKIVR